MASLIIIDNIVIIKVIIADNNVIVKVIIIENNMIVKVIIIDNNLIIKVIITASIWMLNSLPYPTIIDVYQIERPALTY